MPRADRRDLATCPACEGHGRFLSDNGPAPAEYQCDTCFGSGTFDADDLGVISAPVNPGELLDAATDPDVTTAEYEAMVAAKYPEMRSAA
jgi:hypothetical protein